MVLDSYILPPLKRAKIVRSDGRIISKISLLMLQGNHFSSVQNPSLTPFGRFIGIPLLDYERIPKILDSIIPYNQQSSEVLNTAHTCAKHKEGVLRSGHVEVSAANYSSFLVWNDHLNKIALKKTFVAK